MRICVLGAGAIGGILTTHLVHAGMDVVVVDIADEVIRCALGDGFHHHCTAEQIPCACGPNRPGEYQAKPVAAMAEFADVGPVDIVFVCVKTSVLPKVIDAIRPHWPEGATCVSFQNGIDPEEDLAEMAGRDHTVRVVVNFSARIEHSGDYAMNWFHPPNLVGPLCDEGKPRAEEVARLLSKARLVTRVADDIKKAAFEKTTLNASMCPVCALTDLTMAEVMGFEPTRKLVVALLEEARQVGEAMGWTFDNTIDDWQNYLRGGGGHRTSMHADLSAKQPTEILLMNGKICQHGQRLGVPTPHNWAMTWAVLGKEKVAIRKR